MSTRVPALAEATSAALEELQHTSLEAIQWSTAITWAGRALASFQLFEQTGDLLRLLDGLDYAHEALEHAALVGDERLFHTVREPIMQAKVRAETLASALLRSGELHLSALGS